MDITLINEWGGAEIGASLVVDENIGKDLINRGIAKEANTESVTETEGKKLSARKSAAKSGGKEKKS